jgi:hypothetical protein
MAEKKSRREMNRLIKVLKRNRSLKKTTTKSYIRPEGAPVVNLEKVQY